MANSIELGNVLSHEFVVNRDSEDKVLMLNVELESENDVQTIEFFSNFGEQSIPVNGSMVLVFEFAENYKFCISCDDFSELDETLEEGEKLLYSLDGETKKAKIKLDQSGIVTVNDGSDFAVRFTALETAFNELQQAVNTFAAAYLPGGPASQGTPPSFAQSSADISEAKSETIKIP